MGCGCKNKKKTEEQVAVVAEQEVKVEEVKTVETSEEKQEN